MHNKYIVLSKENNIKFNMYNKVAVIFYLFYEDKLDYYFNYIYNIPKEVQLYIITSNEKVKDIICSKMSKSERKVEVRMKINRGRDISALLISAKDILCKYNYVCFLHDKKNKTQAMKLDTELWENNIFENLIGSSRYVDTVLNCFENNDNIGLLIPPAPYSKNIPRWYTNSWLKNYDNTIDVLNRTGCNIDIKYDDFPISIGTVFWARTKALEKLFAYNWTYDDFDEEPLKNDGTISHAIERALPYIVEDAGYSTRIIMNNEWTQDFISTLQTDLVKAFQILYSQYGVRNLSELTRMHDRDNEIIKFALPDNKVYIYGAGDRAKDCTRNLERLGIGIKGYIVTKLDDNDNRKNVQSVENFTLKDEKIVIAVGINYQEDILNILKEKLFFNIYVF